VRLRRVFAAQALLAERRPARALAMAEEALAIREKAKVSAREKAEAQFTVARALVASGRDRARALSLARSARDLYRKQGSGWESSAREVEAWLDQTLSRRVRAGPPVVVRADGD
jgi:hypothetical protein